jgi:hypothetical protein
MNPPATISDRIIQLLIMRFSAALTTTLSALVAIAVTKLSTLIPGVAENINQVEVVTFLTVVIMTLIHGFLVNVLTKHTKPIQAALRKLGYNVDVDGWIGTASSGLIAQKAQLTLPPPSSTLSPTVATMPPISK